MPWTPKQVRFLFSSGSPLSEEQKEKDKAELHANPSLGHRRKKNPITRARAHHEHRR